MSSSYLSGAATGIAVCLKPRLAVFFFVLSFAKIVTACNLNNLHASSFSAERIGWLPLLVRLRHLIGSLAGDSVEKRKVLRSPD